MYYITTFIITNECYTVKTINITQKCVELANSIVFSNVMV